MKMSAGVEWGVHVCILLAHAEGRLVGRKQIAEHYGLSEAYLAKQLKKLVAAGVLRAEVGPAGGYALSRPPGDISLLDVVEAVEGTSPAFVCTEIRQRGAGAAPPGECRQDCQVKMAMGRAEDRWRESLAEETVGEIVDKLSPAAAQRYRATATGRSS